MYSLDNYKNYHNTKIPLIYVGFFLLDLTKTIKVNKLKVYTNKVTCQFILGWLMWKTAVYFWVVLMHISGTTLRLVVRLQHLWIICQISSESDGFHMISFVFATEWGLASSSSRSFFTKDQSVIPFDALFNNDFKHLLDIIKHVNISTLQISIHQMWLSRFWILAYILNTYHVGNTDCWQNLRGYAMYCLCAFVSGYTTTACPTGATTWQKKDVRMVPNRRQYNYLHLTKFAWD